MKPWCYTRPQFVPELPQMNINIENDICCLAPIITWHNQMQGHNTRCLHGKVFAYKSQVSINKRRKHSIHRCKYVNSYIWIWTLHPSLPKIYPYSMNDVFQARPSAWALIRAPSLHWLWPSKVKCISDAPWQHLAGWVPSAFLMEHKSEQPVWDDSIRIHYGVSLRFLHSLFITINSRQ